MLRNLRFVLKNLTRLLFIFVLQCDVGFYFNEDGKTCDECAGGGRWEALFTSSTGIFIIVIIVLAFATWAYFRFTSHDEEEAHVVIDGNENTEGGAAETSSSEQQPHHSKPKRDSYDSFKETTEKTMTTRKKWLWLETKLRALAIFLQIVLNIDFNCDIIFPDIFEGVLRTVSILNLNVLPALGIQCCTSYKKTACDSSIVTILALIALFCQDCRMRMICLHGIVTFTTSDAHICLGNSQTTFYQRIKGFLGSTTATPWSQRPLGQS